MLEKKSIFFEKCCSRQLMTHKNTFYNITEGPSENGALVMTRPKRIQISPKILYFGIQMCYHIKTFV